jgi:arylsulfatase
VELFDLENDSSEVNNLALDDKNRDVLMAMNDKLNRLIDSEVGNDDGFHLPNIADVEWSVPQSALRNML